VQTAPDTGGSRNRAAVPTSETRLTPTTAHPPWTAGTNSDDLPSATDNASEHGKWLQCAREHYRYGVTTATSAAHPQPKADVLPKSARLYIMTLVLLTVALAAVGWQHVGLHRSDIPGLVVLCIMGVIGTSSGEKNVGERISFSFGSIIVVAAVALVGPFGAAVVGLCSYLFEPGRKRHVRLFNAAMYSSIGALSGLVYIAARGVTLPAVDVAETSAGSTSLDLLSPGELLLQVGLPLILADLTMCLANAIVLGGIVRLTAGTPMRRFVTGMLGTSGPAYVGYGVIAFLFVILWWPAHVGVFSALLILPPLYVARWAFVQYGDEQRAHERTISALVAAVEVKDVFTRGHSERVATLCNLMAGALALGHQQTEALRYVGLLHDIGKLGIPTDVLRKTDQLTESDLATIAHHPARGVEMVGDIDFLRDSLKGIEHHHERFDGKGYPDGLSGLDIPLSARVIAVADAFDSLTTDRAHREALTVDQALVELHWRAGTHLDPAMVAALERALTRHTWQPTSLAPQVLATSGRAFDHDDPASSDLMAQRPEALRRRDASPGRAAG